MDRGGLTTVSKGMRDGPSEGFYGPFWLLFGAVDFPQKLWKIVWKTVLKMAEILARQYAPTECTQLGAASIVNLGAVLGLTSPFGLTKALTIA